jgi:hypothetical protein
MSRRLIPLTLLPLAACSGGDRDARRQAPDPVTVAALADPLMTDPDLASQGNASAALGGGGPAQAEIPREPLGPDWVGKARSAAEALAGARLAPVSPTGERPPLAATLTPVAFAAQLPGARACAAQAGYGFIWAAALPARFPVYPRGHALIGAGNDLGGCRLRAVRFTSPVPGEEIAAFYLAQGRAAGLPLDYRKAADRLVMAGSKGKAAVLIAIAARDDGLSEVELATSGL